MGTDLNPEAGEKPGTLSEMIYDSQTNRRARENCDSEPDPNPQ